MGGLGRAFRCVLGVQWAFHYMWKSMIRWLVLNLLNYTQRSGGATVSRWQCIKILVRTGWQLIHDVSPHTLALVKTKTHSSEKLHLAYFQSYSWSMQQHLIIFHNSVPFISISVHEKTFLQVQYPAWISWFPQKFVLYAALTALFLLRCGAVSNQKHNKLYATSVPAVVEGGRGVRTV